MTEKKQRRRREKGRLRAWMKDRKKKRSATDCKPMIENMIIYIIKSIFIRKRNVWMMKKKFFFLLLQLIIYFHWAVLLLWLVVELVDSRFCIRNMSIIVFSLFFSMLLFLFFFFSLNSRLLLILLFHSPHFSGTVCTFRANVLWQMNLGKEKKTEQSIHNIRAYVWSCVENSIDNEQKNISKESIEKVLVLLSLTVLMKRTALEHTHNLCK